MLVYCAYFPASAKKPLYTLLRKDQSALINRFLSERSECSMSRRQAYDDPQRQRCVAVKDAKRPAVDLLIDGRQSGGAANHKLFAST